MKKMITKLLVATSLFSISGFCIMANELQHNEVSDIETRASINNYLIPDDGIWYSRADGKAKSEDSNGYKKTRGTGLKNHYFWVYVRAANGGSIADANASNGLTGLANIKTSIDHIHTASGSLMN